MTALSFSPVEYRLEPPVATARGSVVSRTGYEVTLSDGDYSAAGEVLPLSGWTTTTIEDVARQLEGLAAATDPVSAAIGAHIEVRSGIDAAAWTLRAVRSGRPLWEQLGGHTSSVAVNALVDGPDPDGLRRAIDDALRAGYRSMKAKIGFADDSQRLRAIAERLPDDVRVRLDPNGSWTPSEALSRADEAAALLGDRLEYIEDPVGDIDQLSEIRSSFPVPIAVDELVAAPRSRERVLAEMLADVLVVKPALVGGVTGVLDIHGEADRSGLAIVVSSTYDGPAGLEAWCHVAAAVAPETTHGLGTAARVAHRDMARLVPSAGRVTLAG